MTHNVTTRKTLQDSSAMCCKIAQFCETFRLNKSDSIGRPLEEILQCTHVLQTDIPMLVKRVSQVTYTLWHLPVLNGWASLSKGDNEELSPLNTPRAMDHVTKGDNRQTTLTSKHSFTENVFWKGIKEKNIYSKKDNNNLCSSFYERGVKNTQYLVNSWQKSSWTRNYHAISQVGKLRQERWSHLLKITTAVTGLTHEPLHSDSRAYLSSPRSQAASPRTRASIAGFGRKRTLLNLFLKWPESKVNPASLAMSLPLPGLDNVRAPAALCDFISSNHLDSFCFQLCDAFEHLCNIVIDLNYCCRD